MPEEQPQQLLQPDSTAQAGILSRPNAEATTAFTVVMSLTGFAALAVVPISPTAARDLDGVPLFPMVAGCFMAVTLLGGGLGGHWSDQAGTPRPPALGMVLSVVTLPVPANSVSIGQRAIGRFVDGRAAGTVAVSMATAIGHSYPEHLRLCTLAMMSTSWVLPFLAGPPPLTLITDRDGPTVMVGVAFTASAVLWAATS
ncbi:hypothetical protein [Streptomyces sp. AM 2-1-1]|uniref:hypothetical protein n=1 Tax=Streptomyces sp. AM 2-1-1 TaxID=3028709 RepID=UPI0023BA22F8|nr:hypothetical protein [Streptomyces sp. AM 2-1-1]WEH43348.1 hypothetical protein PZB77_29785 [Streptomyces sp. AM 2-1-1]